MRLNVNVYEMLCKEDSDMNVQKLTQKSMEALQAAHQAAITHRNTQVDPLHLLSALLSQEEIGNV